MPTTMTTLKEPSVFVAITFDSKGSYLVTNRYVDHSYDEVVRVVKHGLVLGCEATIVEVNNAFPPVHVKADRQLELPLWV